MVRAAGVRGALCLADGDCPGGETCVTTGGAFRLGYTIELPS